MMPLRKSKNNLDPTTQKLLEQGIIKVPSKKKKSKTQKLKEIGKVTFNFWSGVKYIIFLSAVLWWLPLFGPMIAGYVGGRRTGGPKRGLIASLLGIGIVGGAYYVVTNGILPITITNVVSYPQSLISTAVSKPFLEPYVRFLRLYWGSFFEHILGGLPFKPNSYVLTIIFAYIGGIISVEKRHEFFDSDESGSNIQINLGSLQPTSTKKKNSKKASASSWNNQAQQQEKKRKRLEDLKAIQFHNTKNNETSSKKNSSNNGNSKGSSKKKTKSRKKDNAQAIENLENQDIDVE
ncbi:MAG: hypothetical protein ACOC5D_02935, partial [Thermoplasmatota archaeon]